MDDILTQDKVYVVVSSDGACAICNSKEAVADVVYAFHGKEICINEVEDNEDADDYVVYRKAEMQLRPMQPRSFAKGFKRLVTPKRLFSRVNQALTLEGVETNAVIDSKPDKQLIEAKAGGGKHD